MSADYCQCRRATGKSCIAVAIVEVPGWGTSTACDPPGTVLMERGSERLWINPACVRVAASAGFHAVDGGGK